jgi:hypothetical protein
VVGPDGHHSTLNTAYATRLLTHPRLPHGARSFDRPRTVISAPHFLPRPSDAVISFLTCFCCAWFADGSLIAGSG